MLGSIKIDPMKRVVDTNELKDLIEEYLVQGQDKANKAASITVSRLFMDVSNKLDAVTDKLNEQQTLISNQKLLIEGVKEELKELSTTYVTKERFNPIERYVNGVVWLVIVAVVGAILAIVVKQ